MKRYTENKAATAANKVLKDNRAYQDREALYNPILTDSGDTIITNGYYMLVFYAAPDGILPNVCVIRTGTTETKQDQEEKHNRIIQKVNELARKWFDYSSAYDPVAVSTPTNDDIRANTDDKKRCKLANGQYVNPSYLRNILQAFPDSKMYSAGGYNPVLFLSEHGRAALLPIRVF